MCIVLQFCSFAVSVYNHAFTNGISKDENRDTLSAFFDTYVETVVGYIGNENAAEFELTSKTTTGKLKKYLKKVEDKYSRKNNWASLPSWMKQLVKDISLRENMESLTSGQS